MAEKNPQVDKDFQDLFLKSPLGPKVLGKIVDETDFLTIAANEEQQIAQNTVKLILSRCGIGFGMSGEKMIRALAGKKIEYVAASEDENE